MTPGGDALFTIETNVDHRWHPADSACLPERVRAAFDLPSVASVEAVAKPSTSSEIFRVPCGDGWTIMRSVDASLAGRTELQARILNDIPFGRISKPQATQSGAYTCITRGRVWLAYAFVDGATYDGQNLATDVLVGDAVALLQDLDRWFTTRSPGEDTSALAQPRHAASSWAELPELLIAPETGIVLSEGTAQLLRSCRAELEESVSLAVAWFERLTPATLVHNDLQHANCLARQRASFFLDVEDICLESVEVSLAHAVFKCLRHGVYLGTRSLADVASSLSRDVFPRLEQAYPALTSHEALQGYGMIRVVSDLWSICESLRRGSSHGTYDLEKKIHNLFELNILTSGAT